LAFPTSKVGFTDGTAAGELLTLRWRLTFELLLLLFQSVELA